MTLQQPSKHLHTRRSILQFLAYAAVGSPSLSILAAPQVKDAENKELEQRIQDFKDVTKLQDLAFDYTNQMKYKDAELLWTKIISLNERNPAAYSNRGNCRTSQGRFDEAVVDFDRAITLAPDEPDPYLGKGVAFEGLGKFSEAIKCYEVANTKSVGKYGDKDPVAYNNIGNAHAGLGDWKEAYENYKVAADMDPKYVFALANEALALYELREDSKAIKIIKYLVRKYPKFSDMHAALAVIMWERDNREEAENQWFEAVDQDSRYLDSKWVKSIRRWPPRLAEGLASFRNLDIGKNPIKNRDLMEGAYFL